LSLTDLMYLDHSMQYSVCVHAHIFIYIKGWKKNQFTKYILFRIPGDGQRPKACSKK